MIVRPAVDIREGQCVQLVGGSYDEELLRLPDPYSVAQDWITKGFDFLHVVDLDRATNRGDNIDTVVKICSISNTENEIDVRVGGGIRNTKDIAEILAGGASSVVVGTQAIAEPEWFEKVSQDWPGQLFVAIEVDGSDVRVKGWQESSEYSLEELLKRYEDLNIAGVFVTAIHKEGRRQGTDIGLFESIVNTTGNPVVASGGVTTIDDITVLAQVGVAEIVLGAAIYTNEELVSQLQASSFIGREN